MSYSKKVQEARMSFTFDDFLLTPNASYVEPKDIDVSVELGKGIKLNIPILSAAMDTVTEAELAIAMAQEGGVGVIHRNITQERQVEEVKKVKNAEDLTIRDVVTISQDSTIAEVQAKMHDELISGLPVVEGDEIIGIISKRDIRPVLKSEPNKAVKDIMTSDVVTVEEGISAEEALNIAYENFKTSKVNSFKLSLEDGEYNIDRGFRHPGGLYTKEDFDRIKRKAI